jgi:FkbM family methyltransferase
MMKSRTLSDHLVTLYNTIFPWKFRYKYGSPFIGSLMNLKGNHVRIKDTAVFLNPRDKTATELFLVHANAGEWIWESYEISLFVASLEANENCVAADVGANYGAYSLSCCGLAKDGRIRNLVTIEPNRDTFACLKKSVEFNGCGPYVQLVNAAAAESHGMECAFYPHGTFSAMSQIAAAQPQDLSGHADPYSVRGITLDGLLPELGVTVEGPLIVKIDIEGGEPNAFRGMEATLKSATGFQVFFELHPGALLSLGHDPLEFGRYLFGLGPDVVAEIDQHKKVTKRIRDFSEFQSIVEGCLSTTEMWQDYTNIFISKGLKVPFEMLG